MNRGSIRAAITVAAVYGYFLLFAQFAFVELLRGAGTGRVMEMAALGAMAVAAIAAGFVTAARGATPAWIRLAMAVAGVAAALGASATNHLTAIIIASTSGAALGVATVTLGAWLPAWCSVVWVGVGTGLGYALCNVPAVFLLDPARQAWVAAGLAGAACVAAPKDGVWLKRRDAKPLPMWAVVVIFTALVWLDSAAFFVIQHAPELKDGTWGAGHLWRNAALHAGGAVAAGVGLARHPRWVPLAAVLLLGVAGFWVNDAATRSIAGCLYPLGVSLYSTALVAWPGWFAGVDHARGAAWRAAWLFAVAGWLGSANGIGMAQSLQRVPAAFVAGAVAVVAGAFALTSFKRWRILAAVSLVIFISWWSRSLKNTAPDSAAERGRQVYIAEGCIHCHSQYPRPGSRDESIWGPAPSVAGVLRGTPVLIGNRRQGPDLTYVGAHRSTAWLKAHFIDPRALAPDSVMPSYAHLFADRRGDDLVAYLKQSGSRNISMVQEMAARWRPDPAVVSGDAAALFLANCAGCHGRHGRGDGPLASQLQNRPADLTQGPFAWTPDGADRQLRVARVIKFGLPGTDMPGHEVMTDAQIQALAAEVLRLRNHGHSQ